MSIKLLSTCHDYIHPHSQISPETYLYQMGVLTLRDLGVEYDQHQQVYLVVPNTCTQRDYTQEYLKS